MCSYAAPKASGGKNREAAGNLSFQALQSCVLKAEIIRHATCVTKPLCMIFHLGLNSVVCFQACHHIQNGKDRDNYVREIGDGSQG